MNRRRREPRARIYFLYFFRAMSSPLLISFFIYGLNGPRMRLQERRHDADAAFDCHSRLYYSNTMRYVDDRVRCFQPLPLLFRHILFGLSKHYERPDEILRKIVLLATILHDNSILMPSRKLFPHAVGWQHIRQDAILRAMTFHDLFPKPL